MAYRKLRPGRIFTGRQLLENKVLVFTENGTIIDLISAEDAGEDTETVNGLLCPGFVNAHCHTELSHMKGIIPKESGMVPFLSQVMFDRHADKEQKMQAAEQAIGEMYKGGITAVGDICNTEDSISVKAGISQLYFHNFIETSGFVPATAAIRIDNAIGLSQQFIDYFTPEQVSITPHAAYSVSEKLFGFIADQRPAIISIHNQESQVEEDFIRHKSGEMLHLFERIGVNIDFFEPQHKSSLAYLLPFLPESTQVILVHNCFTTEEDIKLLKDVMEKRQITCSFCLCPNANLYIGNPLPHIMLLNDSGISICIGTDSLASNDQLSILSELQTIQFHFPFIALEQLLQWATWNGAEALRLEKQLGSFEKGKRPGILLLENLVDNSLHGASVRRIV